MRRISFARAALFLALSAALFSCKTPYSRQKYSLSVRETPGGAISASGSSFYAGQLVRLKIKPNDSRSLVAGTLFFLCRGVRTPIEPSPEDSSAEIDAFFHMPSGDAEIVAAFGMEAGKQFFSSNLFTFVNKMYIAEDYVNGMDLESLSFSVDNPVFQTGRDSLGAYVECKNPPQEFGSYPSYAVLTAKTPDGNEGKCVVLALPDAYEALPEGGGVAVSGMKGGYSFAKNVSFSPDMNSATKDENGDFLPAISPIRDNEGMSLFHIPDAIDGKRVSGFLGAEGAFSSFPGSQNIDAIRIPFSCQKISDGAFSELDQVRTVYCDAPRPPQIVLADGSESAQKGIFYESLDGFYNSGLLQIFVKDIDTYRSDGNSTSPSPFMQLYFDYAIGWDEYRIETPANPDKRLAFYSDAEKNAKVAGIKAEQIIYVEAVCKEGASCAPSWGGLNWFVYSGDAKIGYDDVKASDPVDKDAHTFSIPSELLTGANRVRVAMTFSDWTYVAVRFRADSTDEADPSQEGVLVTADNVELDGESLEKIDITVRQLRGTIIKSVTLYDYDNKATKLADATEEKDGESNGKGLWKCALDSAKLGSCKKVLVVIEKENETFDRTIDWNLEPWIGYAAADGAEKRVKIQTFLKDGITHDEKLPDISLAMMPKKEKEDDSEYFYYDGDVKKDKLQLSLEDGSEAEPPDVADFYGALASRSLKPQNAKLAGISYSLGGGRGLRVYVPKGEDEDAAEDAGGLNARWSFVPPAGENNLNFFAEWEPKKHKIQFEFGGGIDEGGTPENGHNPLKGVVKEETYGEPIKTKSLPRMSWPGYDLIGYANQPQTAEDIEKGRFGGNSIEAGASAKSSDTTFAEDAGGIGSKASAHFVIYFVPGPEGDVMVPLDRPKRGWQGEDEISRGTYWDDDSTGDSITLYGVWRKAEWRGVVEPPIKIGENRYCIYTPAQLGYLLTIDFEGEYKKKGAAYKKPTYYLMNDLDFGYKGQTPPASFWKGGSADALGTDKGIYPTPASSDPPFKWDTDEWDGGSDGGDWHPFYTIGSILYEESKDDGDGGKIKAKPKGIRPGCWHETFLADFVAGKMDVDGLKEDDGAMRTIRDILVVHEMRDLSDARGDEFLWGAGLFGIVGNKDVPCRISGIQIGNEANEANDGNQAIILSDQSTEGNSLAKAMTSLGSVAGILHGQIKDCKNLGLRLLLPDGAAESRSVFERVPLHSYGGIVGHVASAKGYSETIVNVANYADLDNFVAAAVGGIAGRVSPYYRAGVRSEKERLRANGGKITDFRMSKSINCGQVINVGRHDLYSSSVYAYGRAKDALKYEYERILEKRSGEPPDLDWQAGAVLYDYGAGGLVGIIEGFDGRCEIKECCNRGVVIRLPINCSGVGGIVGATKPQTSGGCGTLLIANVYNAAQVCGVDNVAGIVGSDETGKISIESSYSCGNVTALFSNVSLIFNAWGPNYTVGLAESRVKDTYGFMSADPGSNTKDRESLSEFYLGYGYNIWNSSTPACRQLPFVYVAGGGEISNPECVVQSESKLCATKVSSATFPQLSGDSCPTGFKPEGGRSSPVMYIPAGFYLTGGVFTNEKGQLDRDYTLNKFGAGGAAQAVMSPPWTLGLEGE